MPGKAVNSWKGSMMIRKDDGEARNGACPFVDGPLDECYCTDSSSRNVEKIVFFCGHNYEKCGIYRENNAFGKGRQGGGKGREKA